MKRHGILAIGILFLGIFGATILVAGADMKEESKPLDFTLTDTDGKTVKLADLKDKVVVLEWTEEKCPVIQRHAKAGTQAKLAKDYAGKGVVYLGICSGPKSSVEAMKKFRDEYKLGYPILMDPSGDVGRLFGAKTTPHMFVLKNGKKLYEGAIDDNAKGDKKDKVVNYVAKALDEILANKPVTVASTEPYGCSVKYGKPGA